MIISLPIITLIAALLFTASSDKPNTQLSPMIPPTAFLGHYYTCQFKVLGMDSAVYMFKGLPASLSGNNNGLVTGTPNATGSYPITVSYSSKYQSGSANSVFLVSSGVWPEF
jgi:hypothetical protein